MSVRTYPVLLLIAEHGPLAQTEVAHLAMKDKNRIVEAVDVLEAMGAVRRERHPVDRRAHALVLTRAGGRLIEKARLIVEACEEEFLSSLSSTEQKQFRDLLGRIYDSNITLL